MVPVRQLKNIIDRTFAVHRDPLTFFRENPNRDADPKREVRKNILGGLTNILGLLRVVGKGSNKFIAFPTGPPDGMPSQQEWLEYLMRHPLSCGSWACNFAQRLHAIVLTYCSSTGIPQSVAHLYNAVLQGGAISKWADTEAFLSYFDSRQIFFGGQRPTKSAQIVALAALLNGISLSSMRINSRNVQTHTEGRPLDSRSKILDVVFPNMFDISKGNERNGNIIYALGEYYFREAKGTRSKARIDDEVAALMTTPALILGCIEKVIAGSEPFLHFDLLAFGCKTYLLLSDAKDMWVEKIPLSPWTVFRAPHGVQSPLVTELLGECLPTSNSKNEKRKEDNGVLQKVGRAIQRLIDRAGNEKVKKPKMYTVAGDRLAVGRS